MQQGLIIFKPDSPISAHNFTSAQWLQNLLTDDEWDVSHGRYQVLNHFQFFENAQVLYLKQLKLRWIMNELILRSISPISFPCLKELFLNGNNLMSIEPIIQANLPNLQNLNLSNPIKKYRIKQHHINQRTPQMLITQPNLTIPLYIWPNSYKNRITDAQKLTQLNSPKLQKIWYNAKLQNGNIIGSITWMAKLKSNNIKSFIIGHDQRIREEEAIGKLGKRFGKKIKYQYQSMDDRLLNWL